MAFTLSLSELEKEEKYEILKNFTAKVKRTQYKPTPEKYLCFLLIKILILLYLPLGKWQDYVSNESFPNGEHEDFQR